MAGFVTGNAPISAGFAFEGDERFAVDTDETRGLNPSMAIVTTQMLKEWVLDGSGGGGGGGGSTVNVISTQNLGTALALQTIFTVTGGYTPGFIQVYVDGIRQEVGVDVTASNGSTITFTSPLAGGEIVIADKYGVFSVADVLPLSAMSPLGVALVAQPTQAAMQTAIGGTTAGRAWFTAADLAAQKTILGNATASVAGLMSAADKAAFDALDVGAIGDLNDRLTIVETDVAGLQSDVLTLQTDVTAANAAISTNASAITTLQASVTTLQGTTTSQSSAITTLQTQMTAANSGITTNANAITALEVRVTNTENTNTSQASAITSLQSSVTTHTGQIAANASAISSLETRADSIEGVNSSQASAIISLQASVADVNASALFKMQVDASTVSSASIDMQVKAGSGGTFYDAGIRLIADSVNGGEVIITASKFSIVDDTMAGNVPFSVTGGVVTMQNVVINGSLLVNGTVTTPQIGANAVSVVEDAVTAGAKTFGNGAGGEEILQTVTIERTAGTVALIQFCSTLFAIGGAECSVKIELPGGATLTEYFMDGNGEIVSFFYIDKTSRSGSVTYQTVADCPSAEGSASRRAMVVMELKR